MSNDFYKAIQRFIDSFLERTLFFLIPDWIKPNAFSWFRIALVPVVVILIMADFWFWGAIAFVGAALLDSLDGALARRRGQISKDGLILDPLADKLLVGLTLLVVLFDYPFTSLILSIAGLEASMAFLALMIKKSGMTPRPANIWGKTKMLLQSLGVLAIFLWQIYDSLYFLSISATLLWFSLVFLIISAIDFTWNKGSKLYKNQ
ncbi:MAG: CDP-diacylglycerol--glycerol-3-phosphate 3-phosphatidyltransferase [Parcubacteria group bacterium ADurb.Bin326]|nr:MAG: CDP-diacylglycerol--glycerol-3-phosphate 3-phosphatidyltransferase [Parcubacteria group bacterium ADurb.Bin326]